MSPLLASDVVLPETREEALTWLAASSVLGYLGLFVGTGFSKAATSGKAPSFEELLKKVATKLAVADDFDLEPAYRLKSLPQIASQILHDYVEKSASPERAREQFKEEIARICNLAPDPATASRMRAVLEAVKPAWLITTNYDLILESLIEDAESVLPSEPLVPRASRPPIFHLHGHRHSPATITVTEDDYVGLLAPLDYQRLRIPLLLYESATVMLGYSLGDINVRAAMEWSQSFRGMSGIKPPIWQSRVVQALWSESPRPKPYAGPNGEIVVEISDIADFLEGLGTRRKQFDEYLDQRKASIREFLSDPHNAASVEDDQSKRSEFLNIVEKSLGFCQPSRMIDFLSRALDPIWERARQNGGFQYYDTFISLLLDILEKVKLRTANPAILSYLGNELDKVGWYIDPSQGIGSAYGATRTWLAQHQRISDKIKLELRSYATTNDRVGLARVLDHAGVPAG